MEKLIIISKLKQLPHLLYNAITNYYRFLAAKKEANRKHLQDGKRYYVLPTEEGLIVLNKYQINRYNAKVHKDNKIDIVKLLEISYYYTK